MHLNTLNFIKTLLFGILIAVLYLFFVGCAEKNEDVLETHSLEKKTIPFDFAQNVKVDSFSGGWLLEILSERWLLLDKKKGNASIPKEWEALPTIKVPVERAVILSTSYLGYMLYLGVQEKIVGISEKKYIADTAFYRYVEDQNIPSLGNGALLSLERLYSLKPDLVMTFSTGEAKHNDFMRMKSLKIPVILMAEWNEVSPLAKAEWIKVFGILFGRLPLADSLFEESARAYQKRSAQVLAQPDSLKPKVLVGGPIGGVWYAPKSGSYTARLIADAGGKYVWSSRRATDWLQFSLEEALLEGKHADIWIHPSNFTSREGILMNEKRIDLLNAWQSNRVFQLDNRIGPEGGLDFYEGAVVRPELVLEDLIKVFYPHLFEDSVMRWYRKVYIF